MRRTLMQRDQELLEFEFDPTTGDARVIDASPAGVDLLALAGRAESDANEALCKLLSRTAEHHQSVCNQCSYNLVSINSLHRKRLN